MNFRVSGTWFAVVLAAVALAACSSVPSGPAPVVDAGGVGAASAGAAAGPGFYTVQRGDTLSSIGRRYGRTWRELARWNQMSDPNALEVGQVVRVAPPSSTAAAPASSSTGSGKSVASSAPAADAIGLVWPAKGPILARFDGNGNKGIAIGGNTGDPVVAAADGSVVYAGSGLRGYGNLVIIKHNDTYLSAYAHNSKLLVQEDQQVKQGQKIAEMGNTDADRVQLHFELRRSGKPVDPVSYLPGR